jgi:carbon storage regulator
MDLPMVGNRPVASCKIAEAAVERLRRSPYKALSRVSCECMHGVLFLKGHLFSFHEKQVAQEAVSTVNGVSRVVNEIEVDWRKPKERPVLVLSKKPNESIYIDNNIVITVLRIRGKRVRLGIEAPLEMPVNRQELRETKAKEVIPMSVG